MSFEDVFLHISCCCYCAGGGCRCLLLLLLLLLVLLLLLHLQVEGKELEQTENFVYLGGIISTQKGTDKDVERRIRLARGTWQALGKVWNSKELSKATKHACTRCLC